jgi:tripeptidyl-peptidase I
MHATVYLFLISSPFLYAVFLPSSSCTFVTIQVILGVAQKANTTYWSMSTNDQEPFLEWSQNVAASVDPPLVHSMSYGDVEPLGDPLTMQRFNDEIMKLGARGVTVVVSSGDDGVANFVARNNASACGFNPSFPASAPYVLAVGATQGPEVGQPEVVCSSKTRGTITSGSGFSTVFARPSYQDSVVNAFLQGPNVPPTYMFNVSGRAYPDVAVMGNDYNVIVGGQHVGESGTSASAPAFAAMLTLINDARLGAGKPSLGFVNPAIYQAPSNVWNDITQGNNKCCAGSPTSAVCCQYGFTAASGWDAVSGFGSPNFTGLKKYLMNM